MATEAGASKVCQLRELTRNSQAWREFPMLKVGMDTAQPQ
jgi:hypothetical protein